MEFKVIAQVSATSTGERAYFDAEADGFTFDSVLSCSGKQKIDFKNPEQFKKSNYRYVKL